MKDNERNIIIGILIVFVVFVLVYAFVLHPAVPATSNNLQNLSTEQQPTKNSLKKGGSSEGDSGSVETSGTYVASLDYVVNRDGFSFENYGGDKDKRNLDTSDMRRLFGDDVCAVKTSDTCTLSPMAEQWMKQMNEGMAGGHCEGMATLSLLFDTGVLDINNFGASTVYGLSIDGNEKLQGEIAYWFTTQATQPTSASTIKMSPNEIVDLLEESFKTGKTDGNTYTLGIYKRDMTGGHAITPWAIEDREDGTVWILVYDNNYPGANRAIVVDKNENTWKYSASTNPSEAASEYDGDAASLNLELTPTKVRLQKQVCPFCEGESSTASVTTGTVKGSLQTYNELWVDGKGELLVTDIKGKKLGYSGGVLYREIPGANLNSIKGSDSKNYLLPQNTEFTFVIDGAKVKGTSSTDIVMFGPGYDLGILNITLSAGRKDSGSFSAKGNSLSYTTSGEDSPEFTYGIETNESYYGFYIREVGLHNGGTLNSAIDTANGKLSVNTKGNTKNVTLFFEMSRMDEKGENTFGNEEGIILEPNDTVYFNYAKWVGNNGKLVVELDAGSNGTIDETVELSGNN